MNGAFHPTSEIGSGFGVFFDDLVETHVGLWAVAEVVDISNVVVDLLSHGDFGNVGLGVLLGMKLAAFPGRGVENHFSDPGRPIFACFVQKNDG